MRRNLSRMIAILVGSAMLATGALAAQPKETVPATYASTENSTYLSTRASTLLAEIQREAAGLRKNADTLGTFAHSTQLRWQSHADYLNRVKEHINAVGKRIAELQRIRDSVLPWQQQAITEVTTHASQVAASAQAAIVQLNDDRRSLLSPEYRDHLRTIDDSSAAMKERVDKFLNYEKAQQRFLQLQDELELAG